MYVSIYHVYAIMFNYGIKRRRFNIQSDFLIARFIILLRILISRANKLLLIHALSWLSKL